MQLPILTFATASELESYLSGQADDAMGFWLKLSKAGALQATISKDAAIEAALCWGWIDGQLAKFDDDYFLIRMTPRRRGSRWSAKNRRSAERLAREGRLQATGLRAVEAAQADGRWDTAYVSQRMAEPPPDLIAALAENPAARAFFDALDRANRYSIIYRINDAKRPETRQKRVTDFVAMLARGETIHPAKPKKPNPLNR
jgi:uncharacterized protein YdeI (YjbR/CyaY-like superfamily)